MKMIRFTLGFLTLAYVGFAYLFIMMPTETAQMYGFEVIDTYHLYLSLASGATMLSLAIVSGFAFFKPYEHRSVILLLILSNFFVFIVDIVMLARAQMVLSKVLPEMIYFVVVCTLLIRFFPKRPIKETVEELPVEQIVEMVEEQHRQDEEVEEVGE